VEALGINWGLLIAQLFNVGLTIWLLTTLLYRPVLDALNNRTKRVEDSLRDAEAVKQQLAKADQAYQEAVAKGRAEAQTIVQQANERAKAVEAEIRAAAQAEADKIKADAQAQAQQEREAMIRDLRGQMANLVTVAASKVLGQEVKGNYDKLIDDSLAELSRMN
jgi:F-type H+-transporting ATPase subunit b